SGSGPPRECVPSKNSKPVDGSCGVFVSSSKGNDALGNGTKTLPYQTLSTAILRANGRPIYACGESFKEAVTLSAGGALFGALDCTNGWTYYASKKTALTADPDAIPLSVTSATNGAEVHDFAITAVEASEGWGGSVAPPP